MALLDVGLRPFRSKKCSSSRWISTVHAQLLSSPQQQTSHERNNLIHVCLARLSRRGNWFVEAIFMISSLLANRACQPNFCRRNGDEHWHDNQLTFCAVNKALFFTKNSRSMLIQNYTLLSMRGGFVDGFLWSSSSEIPTLKLLKTCTKWLIVMMYAWSWCTVTLPKLNFVFVLHSSCYDTCLTLELLKRSALHLSSLGPGHSPRPNLSRKGKASTGSLHWT